MILNTFYYALTVGGTLVLVLLWIISLSTMLPLIIKQFKINE